MKKLIENIFSAYSHIIEFLKKDRLLGIRNAFYIIVSAFVFWVGFANILPQYNNFLFYFFLLVLFSIMFLFSVDSNRIDIKMITKGEFSTAHEFLKEFSHRSFLYCLFVYSTIISSWVFFLKSIVFFALNLNFPSTYYKDFIIIFVIVSFCLSLMYFSYHIYYSPSRNKLKTIKSHIQLYAAIISTATFFLWCFGLDEYFKLFLSGLAVVFSWLQYSLYIENEKENT